ncbi:hypothetical protein KIN20_006396 [Parelaphostrongylus tenuis]|uniref:Uncharacterized protein n=1 Tax=Parelaphostrongylus tenuis TaxID=148309 RepID=A0AAD5QJB9_PARTN|nr:hypothetical protein KIN20_006396 [Parelaphostrongylus tenuis]
MGDDNIVPHCIIAGNTVTALCGKKQDNKVDCAMLAAPVMIEAIPANHTSISGTLRTTNVIMANWSREMWQSVVSRAVRMLAAGPFVSHFSSVLATVN